MPVDPTSNQGCERPAPPELLSGIEQFNQREYFECHETLEALWNIERAQAAQASKATDQGTSGIVYCATICTKGILQVGVGCYHLLRHNYRGATISCRAARISGAICAALHGCGGGQAHRRRAAAARGVGHARPRAFEEVDLALLPIVRVAAGENHASPAQNPA